ncbi:MAG: shikimate kinase, partial [Christensenellales bacterium]
MGKTDNIILIGFMGTQKTSAGRMLAQLTEREFVDMDNMIEQRAGMRIRELFERFGEEAFREREEALAQELGSRQGLVVS